MTDDVPVAENINQGGESSLCPDKGKSPGISVIISFSNDSRRLGRLLEEFLLCNTHFPVELIIVDSGVSEDISAVISKYSDDFRLLFIRLEGSCSLDFAHNLGAKNAVYPYLLFLEERITYSSDVLPEALEKLEECPEISAVGVRIDEYPGEVSPGDEPGIMDMGVRFVWSHANRRFLAEKISHPSARQFHCGSSGSLQGRFVQALSGSFLLCSRKDFQALNGFSRERGQGLGCLNFCLRLRRDLEKKCWCLTRKSLQVGRASGSEEGSRSAWDHRPEPDLWLFEKEWHNHIQAPLSKEAVAAAPPAHSVEHKWIKSCPDLSGREVCIFTAYEPGGCLGDYKKRYLAALKREGFAIVLVVAMDNLKVKPVTKGLDFVDAILARGNRGFDFAAWAAVMNYVPSVWKARLLILANDSVFGPSRAFADVISNIRKSKADVIGLTESMELEPHLQSYFLALGSKALRSPEFRFYWSEVKAPTEKWDVIFEYEAKFSSFCKSIGLKCSTMFPCGPRCFDAVSGKPVNPTHYSWKDLIERGFPFIKADLIRDNPTKLNLKNWEIVLLRNGFTEWQVRFGIPEVINNWRVTYGCRLDYFHSSRNVGRSKNRRFQWKARSGHPTFFLDIGNLPHGKPGWCAFSITLDSSSHGGTAALYFYTREGIQKDRTLFLTFENNKAVVRITHLDKPLTALRFQPVNRKCLFTVSQIRFFSFTREQAEGRILNTLITSERFRRVPSRSDLRDLIGKTADSEKSAFESVLLREFDALFTAGNSTGYDEWMRAVEKGDNPDLQFLHSNSPAFLRKPLITVVMEAPDSFGFSLRRSLESVLRQSYQRWELIILLEESDEPLLRRMLSEFWEEDTRIKLGFRGAGEGVSATGNIALAMASGDFVTFLDQCDRLPDSALYHYANAVNNYPGAAIIYGDEDKIDESGIRFDPSFKPDWNPDLFFSQNYLNTAFVIRKSLVEKAGGFREGFEACRAYDLLLRCLHHVTRAEIAHLPRILYHRNSPANPEVSASNENREESPAGIEALRDYFSTGGEEGVSVGPGLAPGLFRVSYPVPNPAPLVSLVIPTRDKPGLIITCVSSILEKTTYSNYEILVIDNQSREKKTLSWFRQIQKEDTRVRVISFDQPFNYSAICNFGVSSAEGSIVGLVNNDVEVISPGWLTEMVSHASRREIGCVGAKLYFEDGTLQHGGAITGIGGGRIAGHIYHSLPREHPGYLNRLLVVQNYSAVTAAVLLVRKSTYWEAGGLDENNLTVAFNDVDFCLEVVNAGYRNLWTPYAELYHHESRSRGYENTPERQQRVTREAEFMKRKWGRILDFDPAYSENLTKDDFDCSITIPASAEG